MSPSSSSDEDDRLSARSPSSVPRLRGAANYTTWKATLSAVLLGRGLLSLVTSSTKPLPASDDRLKWERRNEKAYAAIFLSLDPVVTASLPADLAPYDAAALCAQLSTSYASSNGARKAALLELLVNTKLAEGADPLKHLAFLLATYKDLIATGLALDDHSFALIALHSLPGSYQPVTGSLASRIRARSSLLAQAERLSVSRTSFSSLTSAATSSRSVASRPLASPSSLATVALRSIPRLPHLPASTALARILSTSCTSFDRRLLVRPALLPPLLHSRPLLKP
jgi:hypothetical protein